LAYKIIGNFLPSHGQVSFVNEMYVCVPILNDTGCPEFCKMYFIVH
jgi:hypothetical protein